MSVPCLKQNINISSNLIQNTALIWGTFTVFKDSLYWI